MRLTAALLALLLAPPLASAHHSPPALEDELALLEAYPRLREAAQASPTARPGPDAMAGRLSWARLRAEAQRLWLELHPALERAHRALEAPRAPDWWVQAAAPVRACEAGGNYATDTGNGFFGAYQFLWSTWASVGGSGNPAQASPREQDWRAYLLWQQRGWQPWPVCGARAG